MSRTHGIALQGITTVSDLHYWSRICNASETSIYRDALDMIERAIVITDSSGGIRYLNPAAETLLGYSLAEASGWALPALITTCSGIWESVDLGLRQLKQENAVHEVTLSLRKGNSIRVRIERIALPAQLGTAFAIKEVPEISSPGLMGGSLATIQHRDTHREGENHA